MVFRADGTIRTSAGWTARPRENPDRRESSGWPLPPSQVLAEIRTTARRYAGHPALSRLGIDAPEWGRLFQALIEAESGYRADAISRKGAYGLGQLMPKTAAALGVDPADPAANLDGAARYLLAQLDSFGRVDLALAAYNAGPERVSAEGGIPPFPETHRYIARIRAIHARLTRQETRLPGASRTSSLVLKPGTDLP